MMSPCTHVTITKKGDLGREYSETYRLGQEVGGNKIQCLKDGLVHRVCYWPTGGAYLGKSVYTNGETLSYHMEQTR